MFDTNQILHTPAFVLDYERFTRNLQLIKDLHRQVPVKFLFALKGFAMHAVFAELAETACGATASSLNEALLASPYFTEVHAYAPVYQDREFATIAALSKHITFNSLSQYEKHKTIVRMPKRPEDQPLYSTVETALYDPCAEGSRLGVLPEDLAVLPQGLTGLHVHNLCESGARELERTLHSIEHHYGHLLSSISWLNLGGGHLVTRKGYDLELFKAVLSSFNLRHPPSSSTWNPEPPLCGRPAIWPPGSLTSCIIGESPP